MMNERIQELAEQAHIDWINWKSDEDGTLPRSCLEKFAELIVQECLTIINQPNGVSDDDVIRISRDVKEHFGVE